MFRNKVELASDLDSPGLRLAQPGGRTARVSVLSFLPEDGRRSSFRNVVILLKYRRWTKSKKTILQIIKQLRQNPSDFNKKKQPVSVLISLSVQLFDMEISVQGGEDTIVANFKG
jgi:hypothetical protein